MALLTVILNKSNTIVQDDLDANSFEFEFHSIFCIVTLSIKLSVGLSFCLSLCLSVYIVIQHILHHVHLFILPTTFKKTIEIVPQVLEIGCKLVLLKQWLGILSNKQSYSHLSSSQVGLIFANLFANLLCSLIHMVCIDVNPGTSLARLSPAAKQWILGFETLHSPLKVVRSRGGRSGLRTPNSVKASKPETSPVSRSILYVCVILFSNVKYKDLCATINP